MLNFHCIRSQHTRHTRFTVPLPDPDKNPIGSTAGYTVLWPLLILCWQTSVAYYYLTVWRPGNSGCYTAVHFFLLWGYFIIRVVIFWPLLLPFSVLSFCFISLVPHLEKDFLFESECHLRDGVNSSLTMPTTPTVCHAVPSWLTLCRHTTITIITLHMFYYHRRRRTW